MGIELKPEQQRVIEMAVVSGAYKDAEEVLDQAIEIIREQLQLQEWTLSERDSIAAEISAGFAEAERGQLIDADVAIETLRKRRVERLNARK
jgi:antitoxin ParD1/3/4